MPKATLSPRKMPDDMQAAIAAFTGQAQRCDSGIARAPARTRSDMPADNVPAFTVHELRLLRGITAEQAKRELRAEQAKRDNQTRQLRAMRLARE